MNFKRPENIGRKLGKAAIAVATFTGIFPADSGGQTTIPKNKPKVPVVVEILEPITVEDLTQKLAKIKKMDKIPRLEYIESELYRLSRDPKRMDTFDDFLKICADYSLEINDKDIQHLITEKYPAFFLQLFKYYTTNDPKNPKIHTKYDSKYKNLVAAAFKKKSGQLELSQKAKKVLLSRP